MKRKLNPKIATPLRIVAVCAVAGPFIALLILYVMFLALTAWVAVQSFINGTPSKGASMVGLLALAVLVLLPTMALFGVVFAVLQTLLTGLALSLIHLLRVPELVATYLPGLPLGCVRFVLAFGVGLAASLMSSPNLAPEQLQNLGPLSLPFAAALSSAICYLLATRWSTNSRSDSPFAHLT